MSTNFLIAFNDIEASLWVKRNNLYTKNSIDSLFLKADELNVENIFVQVRSRGDALYYSDLINHNQNIENNFDPLGYIITLGKVFNIKIHAWLNTYLIWSALTPPLNENHLYFTNPDWFEVDFNGKSDRNIKLDKNNFNGWEGMYLSPNHPEVNLYLLDIFKELIIKYPELNGIHLDYIRFQDKYFGYNKEGINLFKSIYNFDPRDINRGLFSTKFGWSKTESDSISSIWSNFNCNNISNLVKSLNNFIQINNHEILISAAVKVNPIEARDRWSQNWVNWLENNIMDFVVVMNYTENNNIFITNLLNIKENVISFNPSRIIIGISLYNQNEESVAEKLLLSKLSGFNMISLFPYESIKKEEILINDIVSNYIYKKRFIGD